MNATEIAAWWGALIATMVLVWDVYKWKRIGPIINVSASPDMQTYGGISDGEDDKEFVAVEVTNTGDRKTTLTHLVGFQYANRFQRLLKKRNEAFIVTNPAFSTTLPYVLDPGERWVGGIEQNKNLEDLSRNGFLYCGVYHSSGKKPVLQRVIVRERKVT
ncbi:MAG: hypothetical protein JEZ11_24085 [Desulfobacterales bacterium]|nr:hypothetical protein [Desulfobacterales bacterium]